MSETDVDDFVDAIFPGLFHASRSQISWHGIRNVTSNHTLIRFRSNCLTKAVYGLVFTTLTISWASANPIHLASGTIPIGFDGVADSGGALSPSTVFSFGVASVTGNGTGSFDCSPGNLSDEVCRGWDATFLSGAFAGNDALGQVLTIAGGPSGVTSLYQYVITDQDTLQISSTGQTTSYQINTNGLFRDLRGATGFPTAAASLGITVVQTCAAPDDCSDSASAVFATPPAFLTPEPSTLILICSALLGLRVARHEAKSNRQNLRIRAI